MPLATGNCICRRAVAYLISARVGSMVLVVKVTSNAEPAALRGRHPEVGAASVEDDHELLRRAPKTNLSIVLQVDNDRSVHVRQLPVARQERKDPEARVTWASRKFRIGMSSPPLDDWSRPSCSARFWGASVSSVNARLLSETLTT